MIKISSIILRMWLWYLTLFPCLLLGRNIFKKYYRFVSRRFYRLMNINVSVTSQIPTSKQPLLFIGNHDSLFEPLIIQADLNLQTITQGGNHSIFFALNFIMRKFGHVILHENSRSEAKRVYQQAAALLERNKQFFIFPSSSTNKTLCQQFSSSIYKMAIAKNALIVPIFFHYKNCDIRKLIQEYKNIDLIKQLVKKGLKIDVEFGESIDPSNFANNASFVEQVQTIYANHLYNSTPVT